MNNRRLVSDGRTAHFSTGCDSRCPTRLICILICCSFETGKYGQSTRHWNMIAEDSWNEKLSVIWKRKSINKHSFVSSAWIARLRLSQAVICFASTSDLNLLKEKKKENKNVLFGRHVLHKVHMDSCMYATSGIVSNRWLVTCLHGPTVGLFA